jgi:hypothetical protein
MPTAYLKKTAYFAQKQANAIGKKFWRKAGLGQLWNRSRHFAVAHQISTPYYVTMA